MKVTRRGFLISGAALGGGLVLGFSLWPDAPLKLKAGDGEVLLNGWVKIGSDGLIHAVVPQAEMGQGVTTSLPMLLAEELDADFANVRYEQAPVDGVYVNSVMMTSGVEEDASIPAFIKPIALWGVGKVANLLEIQATGGSTSIRNFWEPIRRAGATARWVLIEAAARRLGVDHGSLKTENSFVIHQASDTKISYADLASDAALINPPDDAPLKDPADFKIIGRATPRLDIPAKVTGEAQFGLDVRLPNMVYAAVRAVPAAGGTVGNVNLSTLRANPNILKAVVRDGFVAVVATHYWYAHQALDGLDIKFEGVPDISSASLDAQYDHSLREDEGYDYRDDGDLEELEAGDGAWLEARYDVPFLAHACLEPMNCTVHIEGGSCTVYVPTQAPSIARDTAADMLDMDKENVSVHTTLLGGGFGRKVEVDALRQAVEIASELDVPVQLIWSREEDTTHDVYRPKFAANMAAYLGADGEVKALRVKSTSQSTTESFVNRTFGGYGSAEPDPSSVEGIANTPYEFPNIWMNHVAQPSQIPVGFWRSVGHSNNAFFMEAFMDEVCVNLGKDAFAVRRSLLAGDARALKVLDELQRLANWTGGEVGRGKGRGMALHRSFGSTVGQVADISLVGGRLKVEKVFVVVDCGQTVNPDTIMAQMESSVIFGLTAALYGEINIDGGEVLESNFHDYEAVTLAQSPDIITKIISNGHAPGGIGEPGTPPIAPAVVNAIFAATGERIRQLPLKISSLDVF